MSDIKMISEFIQRIEDEGFEVIINSPEDEQFKQNCFAYATDGSSVKSHIDETEQYISELKDELKNKDIEIYSLSNQLSMIQEDYNNISNAFFWKITKPMRRLLDCLKSTIKKCRKWIKNIKRYGVRYTCYLIRNKFIYYNIPSESLFSDSELELQRQQTFTKNIKFSIIVPLYNTPAIILREMIESVIDQTYANWELCMADGSDQEKQTTETICLEYANKDSRIKYKKLDKNYGISGNTNACLDMAAGDYICLFDHDDILHPAALYEVMRAICNYDADFVYTDETTFRDIPSNDCFRHYKPDYAPDTLRSHNYICHFTVFSYRLFKEVGYFNSEYDGSQDYDMILRLTERASNIVHIPEILYYWRAHSGSVADDISAKPYVIEAAKGALRAHLNRLGLKGTVVDSCALSNYRIIYELNSTPLVSILIPNCNHKVDLERCLNSIYDKTTYSNYEIIIIENNSTRNEIREYYNFIQSKWKNIKVVEWPGSFNYSAINNYGVSFAEGEYILLLNNDTRVITHDWIQEMLMFAQRDDVGAVGAKLYYPDGLIQHAGVCLGLGGIAGHYFFNCEGEDLGYTARLTYVQNHSAVTGACMMIRRDIWDEVGGLNEELAVTYNDVDMCMKLREAGYLIVWTPYAELYHDESKSRGSDNTSRKRERFLKEINIFKNHWEKELICGDPYYNPNFSLKGRSFNVIPCSYARMKIKQKEQEIGATII